MRPSFLAALAPLVLLPTCVDVPQRSPAPRPAPVRPAPVQPPVAPPPSSDWRDWPIAAGDWSYRSDARGSAATFGVAGAEPLLSLRCDAGAKTVLLSRRGEGTGLTVRTSSVARVLPARSATPAGTMVVLNPRDSLLDAIGFSRGRFIVEASPLGRLVLPAWPEILRVVEDCRS